MFCLGPAQLPHIKVSRNLWIQKEHIGGNKTENTNFQPFPVHSKKKKRIRIGLGVVYHGNNYYVVGFL